MQVRMWQCDSHMHKAVSDPFSLSYTNSTFSCPSMLQTVTIVTCVERLRWQKEVREVGEGENVRTTHQDMHLEISVIHLLDH